MPPHGDHGGEEGPYLGLSAPLYNNSSPNAGLNTELDAGQSGPDPTQRAPRQFRKIIKDADI